MSRPLEQRWWITWKSNHTSQEYKILWQITEEAQEQQNNECCTIFYTKCSIQNIYIFYNQSYTIFYTKSRSHKIYYDLSIMLTTNTGSYLPCIVLDLVHSNYGNYGNSHKFQKNFNLQCEFCKMKGHIKENCYKIVGYPTDSKYKKKGGPPHHSTSSVSADSSTCTRLKSCYESEGCPSRLHSSRKPSALFIYTGTILTNSENAKWSSRRYQQLVLQA